MSVALKAIIVNQNNLIFSSSFSFHTKYIYSQIYIILKKKESSNLSRILFLLILYLFW